MRRKTTFLIGLMCVIALSLVVAACDNEEPPVVTPPETITLTTGDKHIKLGDTGYDFLSGMPQDTVVDKTKVQFDTVGEYKIVYSHDNADSLEKKVFVYDVPQLFKGEALLLGEYGLTYREANLYDFASATDFSVNAKDSFSSNINVTAVVYDVYNGEYGEYAVGYSATDRAGNSISATVTYDVSGENAPTISDLDFDLSGAQLKQIDVDFGNSQELAVYIDKSAVSASEYFYDSTGVQLRASAFNSSELAIKDTYELRIATDLWYVDITANITDNEEPDFSFDINNWIFVTASSIRYPAPVRNTAQRYDFEYTVEGLGGTYTAEQAGNELIITKTDGGGIAAGGYTLTVNAMRGNSTDKSVSAEYTVYTAAAYAKILAPLNSKQHASLLSKGDYTVTTGSTSFTFDGDRGAYRYQATDWDHAQRYIGIKRDSELHAKFNAQSGLGGYLAFDINAATGKDLTFFVKAGADGNATQKISADAKLIFETVDESKAPVAYANMTASKWYTVYILAGALTSGEPNYMRLFSNGLGTPCDLYLRNFRFEDTLPPLPPVNAVNGYVYEVRTTLILPELGGETTGYTVTDAENSPVEVIGGNTVIAWTAGVYTAAIGGDSISFTVLSAADFARTIAPLDSEQYADVFKKNFASDYYSFYFDSAMKAFRYTDTSPNSATNRGITITSGSSMALKFNAQSAKYNYLAFDIYYITNKTNIQFYVTGLADSTPTNQPVAAESRKIFEVGDANETDVGYSNMTTGKWYTVYITAGTLSWGDVFFWNNSGAVADLYLKNFRFEGAK